MVLSLRNFNRHRTSVKKHSRKSQRRSKSLQSSKSLQTKPHQSSRLRRRSAQRQSPTREAMMTILTSSTHSIPSCNMSLQQSKKMMQRLISFIRNINSKSKSSNSRLTLTALTKPPTSTLMCTYVFEKKALRLLYIGDSSCVVLFSK